MKHVRQQLTHWCVVLRRKKEALAIIYNSRFRYLDNVLFIKDINSILFQFYIFHWTNIKDSSESFTSALHLYNIDVNNTLTFQLDDNISDFSFDIIFLYSSSNIHLTHTYDFYVSPLIREANAFPRMIRFIWCKLLTKTLMLQNCKSIF